MRKVIVGAQVSMDGVMQAPGGPAEDPTGGFSFGGWSIPYFDEVFGEEIDRLFKDFDLLLGRKTYEIFAAYWPCQKEDAPQVPVVLGGGKKLFADGSAPHSFKLARSRVSPNGLIVGHYERDGEVKVADATADSPPSELETARRKRLQREV